MRNLGINSVWRDVEFRDADMQVLELLFEFQEPYLKPL